VLAGLLILRAILGKVTSSCAVCGRALNRFGIGVGVIPRGEVGSIFAQIGLACGVIGPPLYAAVVGMVVVTTFLAPPLLKKALSRPTRAFARRRTSREIKQ
jgi:Kef-type K+ transport system membrane component KefB